MNPLADRLRTRARAADHLAASFQTLGLSPRRRGWNAGGGRRADAP